MSFRNIQATGDTEEEARIDLHARISHSSEHFNLWLYTEIETRQVNGTWYAACRLRPVRQQQVLDKTLESVYNDSELIEQATPQGGHSGTGTD